MTGQFTSFILITHQVPWASPGHNLITNLVVGIYFHYYTSIIFIRTLLEKLCTFSRGICFSISSFILVQPERIVPMQLYENIIPCIYRFKLYKKNILLSENDKFYFKQIHDFYIKRRSCPYFQQYIKINGSNILETTCCKKNVNINLICPSQFSFLLRQKRMNERKMYIHEK